MGRVHDLTLRELELVCLRSRILAIHLAHRNGDGHLSSSLSMVEILASIKNLGSIFRNRIILSKGHAALGFYSVFAIFGDINLRELLTYNNSLGRFQSHPDRYSFDQVEVSTGSLGMGLGFANGLALANKLRESPENIFVILGDGECNEGSVWESASFAAINQLNCLTAIVDHNKVQAVANFRELDDGGSLARKFEAFGWKAIEIDGHNLTELKQSLKIRDSKPVAIIAHTSGVKSFPYEPDSVLWHYRKPNNEDLQLFDQMLDFKKNAPDILELFS